MLLVVDVGNTQTHFGVFADGSSDGDRALALRDRARIDPGRARRRAREPAGAARAGVRGHRHARSSPRPCRSCPSSGPRWRGATSATRCSSSDRRSRPGCRSATDNPREVGADRLVNAVAAYERVHDTCVDRRLRDRDHLRRRLGDGRIPRRDHHAGRRDLDRRALRARREAAQGRARGAAVADRQVDGRSDPQRDRVRFRRPGRRDRAPAPRRARRPTPR